MSTDEVIYGVWNTTAGTSSGNYNPNEIPQYAFDQNITTKHSSYGICNHNSSSAALECGANAETRNFIARINTILCCS
jgi:hypothetical protein